MKIFRLDNIPEYVEDTMIRDIRIEKERQLKKEEEDKILKRHFEKVKFLKIERILNKINLFH